jgi:hypothetical protein
MAQWNRGKGGGVQDLPVPWKFRLVLFGLGVATWAVQSAARGKPEWVETIYANAIYPVVREFVGTLTGWTGYSFAELFIVLVVVWFLLSSVRHIRALYRKRRTLRNLLAHVLSFSLALAGVFYTWGMVGWGFNYYRQPFLQTENLDRTGITTDELREVCLKLVVESNELRQNLEEDDNGVMRTKDGGRDALKRVRVAFTVRGQEYLSLRDGSVSRPKGLVFPVLPWLSISGVFFPYTGESNVGMEQPEHNRLFAGCHEAAHQLGWAREEEANFVGYAVCRRHPDADYRYAAAQGALAYSLSALRRADADAAAAVALTLGKGLQRDWDASRNFWKRYDTRLGDAALRVNDAYLKAQGQQEGIRSYGLMVELLVADQRREINQAR